MERMMVQNGKFVDELGRERMFSGVNMVDKRPFVTGEERFPTEFTDEFLEKLQERGVNLIRLGFTWGMAEPQPGQYNEPYLDSVAAAMDLLAGAGIYVLLDIHQDLYSDFGTGWSGDGAPLWACLTDGHKPTPIRFIWDEKYWWDKAVHRSFDHFWENAPCQGKGLLEHYAAFWQHLARRFGDKPALFGFDLINEPYPGTDGGKIFRKLIGSLIKVSLTDGSISRKQLLGDLLHKERRGQLLNQYSGAVLSRIVRAAEPLVRRFDTERYNPFLNRISAAIRQVTDRGIIAIENCYYSNLGIPCSVLPIEVSGRQEPQQCFSPHGYDIMVDSEAYVHASNDRITAIFDEHRRTQQRLQLPVLVGEWGGIGDNDPRLLPHMKHILDIFDSRGWSQTYWHFNNRFLDSPLMEAFSRPYPRAVCGEMQSWTRDEETGSCTLTYLQKEPCRGQTVLFSPVNPVSVQVDGQQAEVRWQKGELSFDTAPGQHRIVLQYEGRKNP